MTVSGIAIGDLEQVQGPVHHDGLRDIPLLQAGKQLPELGRQVGSYNFV